ncbi:hypothetical protein Tco_0293908 [Tanacetum coccineum]
MEMITEVVILVRVWPQGMNGRYVSPLVIECTQYVFDSNTSWWNISKISRHKVCTCESQPLYYNYLRPLTSLDEGLYALACEEDVRYLATLVRSFKLIEVYIEHGVTVVDSYRRPPPRVRATIEDISKHGSTAAIEHRSEKILLLTWHDSSAPTKEHVCDYVAPRSLPQYDSSSPSLGWVLKEIHVTWAHLEKKRTRLRLYTKYFEEIVHTVRGDDVANPKRQCQDFQDDSVRDLATASEQNANPPPTNNPPVLPTALRAEVVQELNDQHAISTYIDFCLENIDQFLNGFTQPPNEIDMDDLKPDDESVDTPLVSPFLDSDDDSDDGEVLNELEEYGNA